MRGRLWPPSQLPFPFAFGWLGQACPRRRVVDQLEHGGANFHSTPLSIRGGETGETAPPPLIASVGGNIRAGRTWRIWLLAADDFQYSSRVFA